MTALPSRTARAATVLLVLAGLAAAVSGVGGVVAALAAGPSTVLVEAWRAYGLLVFAGIFTLLAFTPQLHLVLWLLAIGHKIAMTVTAAAFPEAADAGVVAVADGVLSAVLLIAFALAQPWRGRRPVAESTRAR